MDERARRELDDAMARLADGDRSALPRLARGLDGRVRRFCAQMLGPGPDADDAAQEALLELFARASSYERGKDVLAWALTIAAWECRTVRRRRTRSRTGALVTEPPSELPLPDESLDEDAMRRAIDAAADELSDDDRQVLADVLSSSGSGPTFRKRKERMITRLRASFRRLYGIDE